MNTKEEVKAANNSYYRTVNNFTVKAGTIIYLFSTLAVLFQYLKGSNNIYLVSMSIFSTLILPIAGSYLMKNDRDEIIPWFFSVLFQISFAATIMSSQLPAAMTIVALQKLWQKFSMFLTKKY